MNKYGTGFLDSLNGMHFASGGLVEQLLLGDAGLGSFLDTEYGNTNTALVASMEAILAAAVAQAKAEAGATPNRRSSSISTAPPCRPPSRPRH